MNPPWPVVASSMSLWLLWWPPTGSSMFMFVVMLLIYSILHCLYSVGNKITTTTTTTTNGLPSQRDSNTCHIDTMCLDAHFRGFPGRFLQPSYFAKKKTSRPTTVAGVMFGSGHLSLSPKYSKWTLWWSHSGSLYSTSHSSSSSVKKYRLPAKKRKKIFFVRPFHYFLW